MQCVSYKALSLQSVAILRAVSVVESEGHVLRTGLMAMCGNWRLMRMFCRYSMFCVPVWWRCAETGDLCECSAGTSVSAYRFEGNVQKLETYASVLPVQQVLRTGLKEMCRNWRLMRVFCRYGRFPRHLVKCLLPSALSSVVHCSSEWPAHVRVVWGQGFPKYWFAPVSVQLHNLMLFSFMDSTFSRYLAS
jgi:hypothetical protein